MQPSYLKDFLDCHVVGGKTEGKKIRSVYSTNVRETDQEREASIRRKRCSWLQYSCMIWYQVILHLECTLLFVMNICSYGFTNSSYPAIFVVMTPTSIAFNCMKIVTFRCSGTCMNG